MKKSEIFLMILQVPVDFVMLLLAGISAYYFRFSAVMVEIRPVIFHLSLPEFMQIVAVVSIGWLIIFAFAGLYSIDPNKKLLEILIKVFFGCSTGLAAVALYIMFTQQMFDSRFLIAVGWVFAILYVGFGRLLIRGLKSVLYRLDIGLRRVVVVGSERLTEEITKVLKRRKELGYKVVMVEKVFHEKTGKKILSKIVDEVILINPRANAEETIRVIEFCNEHHITFKYSADLFDTYSTNMNVSPLAGVPVVELKRTRLDGWGRVIKRLFDIIGSLVLMLVLSPLFLLVSIGILLETGRPVIYKNERIGLHGKKFFTLKFRSMFQKDSTGIQFGEAGKEAEQKEKKLIEKKSIKRGPIYKILDDPRVTKFGKFIRRWSMDELPQFINVFLGQMSLVGPRPHQLREVVKYDKKHKKVFSIKPGVTGLAQISGRSDLSFEEEIRLDIFYIENWNPLLDIIIFIKTPFIVLKKRKAL